VPGDDWKAALAAATNRSPKASRKLIRSLDNFFVIFFFLGPACKKNQCNRLRSMHFPSEKTFLVSYTPR
jgi:hypothetical protein